MRMFISISILHFPSSFPGGGQTEKVSPDLRLTNLAGSLDDPKANWESLHPVSDTLPGPCGSSQSSQIVQVLTLTQERNPVKLPSG